MKTVSKNFTDEKRTVGRIIKIFFYIACVLFFYISIPLYVIYQAVNVDNSKELKSQLKKNLISSILYYVPYLVFLFFLALAQSSSNSEPATVTQTIAMWMLLAYMVLHMVLTYYAAKTKDMKQLKMLLWLPAAVFAVGVALTFI